MNEIEIMFDVAVLGDQVDSFMRSDVGKYLIAKADQEIKETFDGFRKVLPSDVQAVTLLQNRLWRAESIKRWLSEAVVAGLKAKDILEERDVDHE